MMKCDIFEGHRRKWGGVMPGIPGRAYHGYFEENKELFGALDRIIEGCADSFSYLLVTWDETPGGYVLCVDVIAGDVCCGTVTVGEPLSMPIGDALPRLRAQAAPLLQKLRLWYSDIYRDFSVLRNKRKPRH